MNDPVKPDTAVLESLFDPLKISPGANSTGPAEPGVVPAAQEPLVNVNLPAVVVVGSTGSGKSQFLNFLAQKNLFMPIPDADRKVDDETYLKHAQLDCTCFEKKTQKFIRSPFLLFLSAEQVLLVDTPGLSDTGDRDSKHLCDMVRKIKTLLDVRIFAFVLNSNAPRFDRNVQEILKVYQNALGPEFWDHIVLVFSRYEMDDRFAPAGESHLSHGSYRTFSGR